MARELETRATQEWPAVALLMMLIVLLVALCLLRVVEIGNFDQMKQSIEFLPGTPH